VQVYSFFSGGRLAPSTIKLYLSAVRHLQLSVGLPDPKIADMARLEQVVKGAKREYTGKEIQARENGYPLPRIFFYR
jgi:hypothetical protein